MLCAVPTPDLDTALREGFGFADFNPGQREVIEHLLAGRSAAAVFATGALLPGLTRRLTPDRSGHDPRGGAVCRDQRSARPALYR